MARHPLGCAGKDSRATVASGGSFARPLPGFAVMPRVACERRGAAGALAPGGDPAYRCDGIGPAAFGTLGPADGGSAHHTGRRPDPFSLETRRWYSFAVALARFPVGQGRISLPGVPAFLICCNWCRSCAFCWPFIRRISAKGWIL